MYAFVLHQRPNVSGASGTQDFPNQFVKIELGFLEDEDASPCMEGDPFIGLGIEFGQFLLN
jgi:hypothetical protein